MKNEIIEMENYYSWLAGFWEGEGFLVHQRKGRHGYAVGITQAFSDGRTVKSCMEKIKVEFGGSLYESSLLTQKDQIRWYLSKRKDIIYFLKTIYSYCQIRKKQIKDALKDIANYPLGEPIDIKILKKLRKEGKSYEVIAKILKIGHNTAWDHLAKNGRHYNKNIKFTRIKGGDQPLLCQVDNQ